MNIWESVKIALRALRSNKMRTILTMLGIIIGVGAVIAMVAIGQGAAARIKQQFEVHGDQPPHGAYRKREDPFRRGRQYDRDHSRS